MPHAARSSSQEYWRPANPEVARLIDPRPLGEACWRCGMEYSPAARFCHICGSDRGPRPVAVPDPANSPATRRAARTYLGLSTTSFVLVLASIFCVVSALLTGFFFHTDTLADWQAVQTWRIEWLLGASAALLAGILFNR